MARFEYLFRETTSGLRRNGLVAFAAISTTFIALLLFGLSLLISRQVSLMIEATTGNVEVAVYLTDPVNPATVRSLSGTLTELPVVENVDFESKQEACDRFKELFANQPALVNNVNCDALPASLRVKLEDPEQYAQVEAVLQGQPGIDRIVDQSAFLDRLFAVTRVFRVGVLLISFVMLVSAAILIDAGFSAREIELYDCPSFTATPSVGAKPRVIPIVAARKPQPAQPARAASRSRAGK